LRCLKFGITCDGYAAAHTLANKQILLPKRQDSPRIIFPAIPMFQDEHEYQYFNFFRDEVAPDISGPIPNTIWTYVVVRASTDEPALRYLSIAIAALHKSEVSHQRFAVNLYARALKRIQTVISTCHQEEATRISLIASLLIFCFENTLGEPDQAIAHFESALSLMSKQLPHSTRPYSKIRPVPSIPHLEDEVLDAFMCLDNTVVAGLRKNMHRPKMTCLRINYSDNLVMPRSFQDVIEAKKYLAYVQYKAMPFLAHMPEYYAGLASGGVFEPNITQEAFDELSSLIHEFTSVFEPMLERGCLGTNYQEFAAAATIRVIMLSTELSVYSISHACGIIASCDMENKFRELVALSGRVVRNPRFKRTFVMDCGIVPCLFVVVVVCQSRDLKLEAVRLLREAVGRKEVVWDAKMIADMGDNILKAEGQLLSNLCKSGN